MKVGISGYHRMCIHSSVDILCQGVFHVPRYLELLGKDAIKSELQGAWSTGRGWYHYRDTAGQIAWMPMSPQSTFEVRKGEVFTTTQVLLVYVLPPEQSAEGLNYCSTNVDKREGYPDISVAVVSDVSASYRHVHTDCLFNWLISNRAVAVIGLGWVCRMQYNLNDWVYTRMSSIYISWSVI